MAEVDAGAVVSAVAPKGIARLWKSSKTWLLILGVLLLAWLNGGFTEEAVKDIVELVKWGIPLIIGGNAAEDFAKKLFGKTTELTK